MLAIYCDGQILNPCLGLTEAEVVSAFRMYSGPQASKGHTYTLMRDGKPVETVEVPKKK